MHCNHHLALGQGDGLEESPMISMPSRKEQLEMRNGEAQSDMPCDNQMLGNSGF